MPTWSTDLPAIQKHMGFDILRTPTGAPLQAIITCTELLVCDTHYWGGRTIPCERHQLAADGSTTAGNCPACNESVAYRTHVYVSALDMKTRDHFIFECTAHGAKPLAEYRAAAGTLRGCMIVATRPKAFKNGKVVIETSTANLGRFVLPDPPNLILALCTIWRLPGSGVAAVKQKHRAPEVHTRREPLNRMREQPDNQPDPLTVGEVLSGNGNGLPPLAKG